jgi:hypothetical protein
MICDIPAVSFRSNNFSLIVINMQIAIAKGLAVAIAKLSGQVALLQFKIMSSKFTH